MSNHLTLPSYPIIRQFQSVEGDEGLQIMNADYKNDKVIAEIYIIGH